MSITVVIADRHPVVLQGLSSVLEAHSDFKIVASCTDGPGCVEAIRNLAPDIAILDGSMPGVTGPEILSIVNAEKPSTRFVFFTASEVERELVMSAAADGYSYISKDVAPEILVQSLRQVAGGGPLLPLPLHVVSPFLSYVVPMNVTESRPPASDALPVIVTDSPLQTFWLEL